MIKELEDFAWFPRILRDFQTDFVGFVSVKLGAYRSLIPPLQAVSASDSSQTDLCSGSGEPSVELFRSARCFRHLYLTDKFPNRSFQFSDEITYDTNSQDVLSMEFKNKSCYTMLNSFHHFSDIDKQKLVERFLRSENHAFIVEVLEPNLWCYIKILFLTTVGCLLLTPFIRPVSLSRLFFTYIIPVNLLTITFDGIVSVFKSRTINQYRKLFAAYSTDRVKIFRLRNCMHSNLVIHIRPTNEVDLRDLAV